MIRNREESSSALWPGRFSLLFNFSVAQRISVISLSYVGCMTIRMFLRTGAVASASQAVFLLIET